MKYIDADQIRAEIKQRIKLHYKEGIRVNIDRIDEDEIILAWLDSLPEQPVEGLEEEMFKEWGTTKEEYLAKSMDKVHLEMEIATYLQDWEDDDEIGLHLSTDEGCMPIELEDVRDLARHFAEWQKKRDDIETADLLAIAHLQGMEQQKSKMLEDAVEFECIGKKVKMTIQELINYYIDQECCDVADECGF